jgi:hypothetical protein
MVGKNTGRTVRTKVAGQRMTRPRQFWSPMGEWSFVLFSII